MDIISITYGVLILLLAVATILFSIPLIKGKAKMDSKFAMLYGAHFDKSYESEELWYKINKYAGKQFILWFSIPLIILGVITFFLPLEDNVFLILSITPLILAIVAIPIIKTYLYSRKL